MSVNERMHPHLSRLVKWVSRYDAANSLVVKWALQSLSNKLDVHGYVLIERDYDGFTISFNDAYFQYGEDGAELRYISVIIHDAKILSFSVSFGRQIISPGIQWVRAGHFVKWQDEAWSAKLMGPRWYFLDKTRKFVTDWLDLEGSVEGIVRFLEDGSSHSRVFA